MRHRPSRHRLTSILGVAGLLWIGAACDGSGPTDGGNPPRTPPPLTAASCALPGTEHVSPAGMDTLRAADGPHHLLQTLTLQGPLTIEPGTLVCGGAAGGIRLEGSASIYARGTADAPILLTATDSTRPWGGIGSEPENTRVTLIHVRLEHARVGVMAGALVIDSAVIRRIRGSGIGLVYSTGDGDGRVHATVIDSVCLAPGSFGAAIGQDVYTSLDLSDVVIRDAGCGGIAVPHRSGIGLTDVTVRGSLGIGISLSYNDAGYPFLRTVHKLRITGGASYPLSGPGERIGEILAAVPEDSLLGNAADSLIVHNGAGPDGRVTARLPWIFDRTVTGTYELAGLSMEPGSTVRFADPETPAVVPRGLTLAGTPTEPITLIGPAADWPGIFFISNDETPDTSRISHARLINVPLHATPDHVLILEDVTELDGFFAEARGG